MIRVGVLGTANIALRSIIPSILELTEDYHLVGVASRSFEKAKKIAAKLECETFVGYESILNLKYVDAIYIPLPNSMHYEWVKKSLQAGVHVLVEKSLAMNLHEVEELSELARKSKLALVENFQFRFHNQFVRLKGLLEDQVIGEIRYIKSAFEFPPFPDQNNIRYNQSLGGGALMDAGAYPIKVSSLLLGANITVAGSFLRIDENFGVDVGGGGLLINSVTDNYSLISFGFDNNYQCSIEVFGSSGSIKAERIFTAPPDFTACIELNINKKETQLIKIEPCNHFKNMLVYFCKAISNDEIKGFELEQNITQARIIQEFIKKNKNG